MNEKDCLLEKFKEIAKNGNSNNKKRNSDKMTVTENGYTIEIGDHTSTGGLYLGPKEISPYIKDSDNVYKKINIDEYNDAKGVFISYKFI